MASNEESTTNQSGSFWSQLLPFTPIITLILGFFLNSGYEQFKHNEDIKDQIKNQKKAFLDKQLLTLYYPLKNYLQKDDAVWTVWNNNQFIEKNKNLARYIENKILFPNHDSISVLIDRHFDLIRNIDENYDISNLNRQLIIYQRHIAVYKALRNTNDYRNTVDLLNCNCSFPKGLEKEIDKRIISLEQQRSEFNL